MSVSHISGLALCVAVITVTFAVDWALKKKNVCRYHTFLVLLYVSRWALESQLSACLAHFLDNQLSACLTHFLEN